MNQSFSLCKSEIIRGHNSFNDIFKSSHKLSSGSIKFFYNVTQQNLRSPHKILKVGFVVSAKKINSAVLRNKARRLLKEAYRNIRYHHIMDIDAEVLVGLSDYGYDIFKKQKGLDYKHLKNDIEDAFSVLIFKLRKR